ncbi:MAG: urease accessory protein UreD [Acidimicrobiales bacterium]
MGAAPPRPLAHPGGGRLKAAACIVAESVDGRTVYRVLRAEAPMALRRVDDAVFLVSSAAHPVGGDELVVRIDAGPGAHVVVRSVAAMLVWPGPAGESSTLRYEVSVAAGGSIDVAPEPTVAVSGCRHRNEVTVDLTGDARLRWRDEVVLGRAGEAPGNLASTIRVTRDGRLVLATGTRVGGDVVAWSGPAVTAGRRRLVTEVRVGDDAWVGGDVPPIVVEGNGLVARHEPAPRVVVVTGLA